MLGPHASVCAYETSPGRHGNGRFVQNRSMNVDMVMVALFRIIL